MEKLVPALRPHARKLRTAGIPLPTNGFSGARPTGPHPLAVSLRGFDHLFDPAEAGDRVQEADRRQGKEADVAHFLPALALAERAARVGADGSLRLCAEGDSELDEPG